MRIVPALCLVLALLGCGVVDNAVDRTTIEVRGGDLILNGQITSRTPANFDAAIEGNPQIRRIVLMDMPGSVDENAVYDMGYAIRDAGLTTHLTAQSEISSGAVSLFIAGERRTMVPGAVIGVHSWSDGFGEGSRYPADAREHRGNVAYTEDMLGNAAFYWFTLQAAPSDGIHVMTGPEITRFRLTRN